MTVLANAQQENPLFDILKEKIHAHSASIAIVGLGYVGLPLALTFHKKGFPILGFDTDTTKINTLASGKSYIKGIAEAGIRDLVDAGKYEGSSSPEILAKADAILICVPTPLTKNREPDMSYVLKTTQIVAKILRPGQLIVLESTTYPGTTAELMRPILEETGLKAGIDFYLAYSPEREDPGNPNFATSTIPKVVGADDTASSELALELYAQIVPKAIAVSSSRTAEAVKLTENIFRSANIALVNELKVVYAKMGIDIWEVIDAAKTKPFGFMPFYPGPGLGGHCIPIDPFYLTWKAREFDIPTRFVELSGEINSTMPVYVIDRLREEMDARFGKGLKNTRILLVGLAYKKNVDDLRESPTLLIADILQKRQAHVDYHDPFIDEIHRMRAHENLTGLRSVPWTEESLKSYDAAIICTDHDDVDYEFLVHHTKLVIDTRNATHRVKEKSNVAKA